jgi:ABC-type branched-subunit amino acid transport system substrate-binding protein
MNHGGRAARLIAGSASRLGIVAVTGLGVSRTGTKDALKVLDAAGIPTLGTLLSADELTRTVVSYHQVGPANSREAAVAAFYAKDRLKVAEAAIFYSGDPADIYSQNLAEDVRREFGNLRIRVQESTPYRTRPDMDGADVTSLGQQACPARPGYLIFFAGRPDDFGRFLQGMKTACPDRYPQILAGDAVTEFVTGGLAGYPGLPLSYMSPASSRVWGPDCADVEQKVPFFAQYRAAGYGDACGTGQSSRAMFGWDAMAAIWTAAVQVTGINPEAVITSQAVLQGLNSLTGAAAVQGITGALDFSRGGASPQLPLNKTMLVLSAGRDGVAELVLQCGTTATALAPDPRCPTDGPK